MKIKQIVALLALALALGCGHAFAQDGYEESGKQGRQILDKSSGVLSKKKSVAADLLVTIENGQTEKKSSMKGRLQAKQAKFKLTLPDAVTYYDGRTEYVHLLKSKEVNVSEPEAEDLESVNPLYLLKMYQKGYKIQYFGQETVGKKRADLVKIYPDDRSKNYSMICFYIDKATQLPLRVVRKGKDGIDVTVDITVTPCSAIDDAVFVFDKDKNKDVEIIDLR